MLYGLTAVWSCALSQVVGGFGGFVGSSRETHRNPPVNLSEPTGTHR